MLVLIDSFFLRNYFLSHLFEEPGELSPVIPLHPCGRAVVEAVHAHVLVVVPAEDLGHQEAVGKVASKFKNVTYVRMNR